MKTSTKTLLVAGASALLLSGCGSDFFDSQEDYTQEYNIKAPKNKTTVLDLTSGSFYVRDARSEANASNPIPAAGTTIKVTTYPTHGSIYLNGYSAEYTPEKNYIGPDKTVIVSEDDWEKTTYTVSYNVVEYQTGGGPIISGNPPRTVEVGSRYYFKPVVSEPDGDTLVFSILNIPSWLTFNQRTGELSGEAPNTTGNTGQITITVDDGDFEDSIVFSIEIVKEGEGGGTCGDGGTTCGG